jgi:hypothetical protein
VNQAAERFAQSRQIGEMAAPNRRFAPDLDRLPLVITMESQALDKRRRA